MSIWATIFCILGVLAALAALCLLVIWFEKHGPEGDFDERQRIAQGNAYRISFWVCFTYAAFLELYLGLVKPEELILSPRTLIQIGVLMALMVFHIYCLLTHSALPLSGHPTLNAACYGVLALHFFTDFRRYLTFSEQYRPDKETLLRTLVFGMCFAALAVMYLISAFWKEKE